MHCSFLGTNPYWEPAFLGSGVNHRLMSAIANHLASQLRPKYIVVIEERVYQMSREESLLIRVPSDVSVQRTPTATNIMESSVAVVAPTAYPIKATIA